MSLFTLSPQQLHEQKNAILPKNASRALSMFFDQLTKEEENKVELDIDTEEIEFMEDPNKVLQQLMNRCEMYNLSTLANRLEILLCFVSSNKEAEKLYKKVMFLRSLDKDDQNYGDVTSLYSKRMRVLNYLRKEEYMNARKFCESLESLTIFTDEMTEIIKNFIIRKKSLDVFIEPCKGLLNVIYKNLGFLKIAPELQKDNL